MSECDTPAICPTCGEKCFQVIGAPRVLWFPGTTRGFFKEKLVRHDPDEG